MRARILFLLLGIALSAAALQAQPVISFETSEIVVSASGHPVALLLEGSARRIEGANPGGDGLVHIPVPKTTVMSAIAVDLATGQIGFNAIGTTPQTVSMPAGLVMRNTDNSWSRLVLPDAVSEFLWIRPGSGAWGQFSSNIADEDLTSGNGVRFTQASALQTFYMLGSKPLGMQNGDVFIAFSGPSTRIAGTVDGLLASTSAGTIPFASPSPYSLTEGASREIVLMRTLGTQGSVSVRLRTVPGTATPGVDYTTINQIVTFDAGEAIKKVTLNTIDDDAYNPPVALTLELLDATGTTITGGSTRAVDIATNDPLPSVAFGSVPASVAEQNAPWTLNLPVVLTGKSRVSATANYAILRDGLAGPTGSVAFSPGQATASIPLNVPGNTTPEPNYVFTVHLNPGANATVGAPDSASVTVTNDDVASLSVADVSVLETNAPGVVATFHIALSQPMPAEVRVSYATAGLDATSGSDFVAKSGVAVLPPGQTSVLVNVEIAGDTVPESDEKFTFTLSDPVNATITRAVATGTIRDDDTSGAAPMLSVSATTVMEKTGANADAAFRVTLAPAQAQEVRVSYATADGTAVAGSDYVATSGVLTFAPGETSKVVTVPVLGDSTAEPNETFSLVLSSPAGAGITAPGRAEITIVDDDQPQVDASDNSVSEAIPTVVVTMRVTPPGRPATVSWTTANGTATAGHDYVATSGTATFAESQNIVIQILQDSQLESTETFYVDFTSVANATLVRQRVAIAILDDDRVASARVSVADATVIETTGIDATATFKVTLASPVTSEVRVSYATSDLTATSGLDYIAKAGTLVFAPGQTSADVAVTIFGDAIAEADEKFRLTLSNAVNATVERTVAEATIQDDDSGPRPSLTIAPVRVIEGTGATKTDAVFIVTLSAASNSEVRVDYATLNGSAIAGADYVMTAGTLSFAPGELSKAIVVPVIGDSTAEPEERFNVALANASGAFLGTANAAGTIVDDDLSRFRAVRH